MNDEYEATHHNYSFANLLPQQQQQPLFYLSLILSATANIQWQVYINILVIFFDDLLNELVFVYRKSLFKLEGNSGGIYSECSLSHYSCHFSTHSSQSRCFEGFNIVFKNNGHGEVWVELKYSPLRNHHTSLHCRAKHCSVHCWLLKWWFSIVIRWTIFCRHSLYGVWRT